MNYGISPIDVIDADGIQADLERIIASSESGKPALYQRFGGRQLHPTAGVAAADDHDKRSIRIYRGSQQNRMEPGADVGAMKVIVLKSDLAAPSPIEPQAGDIIIEPDGKRFAVEAVDYGDVGSTRVYYLLDVKAIGKQT